MLGANGCLLLCSHTNIPHTHTCIHPTPQTHEFHIQVKAEDMAARATARGRTAVRAASTVVDFVFDSRLFSFRNK